MTDFFLRIKQQQEQQLPFVMFRKPDDKRLVSYLQSNDHLYFIDDYSEKGFVIAPFNGEPIPYFPESESEIHTAGWFERKEKVSTSPDCNSQTQKNSFEKLVDSAILSIEKGEFKKVVLSRKEDCSIGDFDAVTAFENLLGSYPSAFVYCWYHPKIGMWLGASPEQLLRCDGRRFSTVALAGTQKFNGSSNVKWHQKEKEEQQFVTDFLLESIRPFASELIVSSPYTARAGKLLHIKTDIEGIFKKEATVKDALQAIQPTPAVCGLPRREALNFIFANEGYDREFYTGFLGEINSGPETEPFTDLYVNLRCMKIAESTASIYVGCGVTKDSNAEKEYLETVDKSMTIKEIL
ncbi:MAG: chorismate-binding protein [Flavobacterium sp.]|nr:chorismate-binding protein [Flavobacterium sp.]